MLQALCYLLKKGQPGDVGLRGRYAARLTFGGARVTLQLRGLLGIQVEGVYVKACVRMS